MHLDIYCLDPQVAFWPAADAACQVGLSCQQRGHARRQVRHNQFCHRPQIYCLKVQLHVGVTPGHDLTHHPVHGTGHRTKLEIQHRFYIAISYCPQTAFQNQVTVVERANDIEPAVAHPLG